MNLLTILLICAAVFWAAYRLYGSLLTRLVGLRGDVPTPAVALRDDVDFVPIEKKFLLSQHFSAIAAAGPIVGPILAGVYFGWLPALLWIVLGSIFVGGVHDFFALVGSIRHKAGSIAQIVREHMSRRSYVLFLLFIWIALVYIIVAFTDIVASSFVGTKTLANGQTISGGATATSSLLYLALPVIMGLLLRYTKLSVGWATVIFLPLVGVAIWAGPYMPFDLASILNISQANAVKTWDVLLLVYCLIAAGTPMWLLLQPRGHLGGYFLFVAIIGAGLGILISGVRSYMGYGDAVSAITYPAFMGFHSEAGGALFPMLFITIACGACSGFHCLIASGTTSKQLKTESDAKLIGYGAMLIEGMVSVVSLACVMMLTVEAAKGKSPDFIYAMGSSSFLAQIGIPVSFGVMFALLAFTTFVYDTLDVCTRLGRYIFQELTGMEGRLGRWMGTFVTAAVPLLFVMQTATDAKGNPIPAWRMFWALFGASNQLLAALALIGLTVWLWRTYRREWVWVIAGIPTVVMYVMSVWALLSFIRNGFFDAQWVYTGMPGSAVPWAALVLVCLAILVMVEAVRMFAGPAPLTVGNQQAAIAEA